jgi:SlyX protein
VDNDSLIELQTQLAFQEHSMGELNAALVAQQQQIDLLKLELRHLKDKLGALEDRVEYSGSSQEEKPPHY